MLNKITCWFRGHDWQPKEFKRSMIKGRYYMRLTGMYVCARCNEGVKEFNKQQSSLLEQKFSSLMPGEEAVREAENARNAAGW